MALTEWGLTPEYINRNWTEELWQLMIEKRTVRLMRKAAPQKKAYSSNQDFFARHSKVIGYHNG